MIGQALAAVGRVLQGFGTKISGTGPIISYNRVGQPVWTGRNFAAMSREAYQKNVIAYRAIKLVARGAAKIPWILRKRSTKAEIEDPNHPLKLLLHRPNPWIAGADFFEGVHAFYMLSGNSYLEGVVGDFSDAPMGPGRPPDQLFSPRPDRMKVVASNVGTPMGYVYENNSQKKTWKADAVNGSGAIIHWKSFHPMDDWYGMAQVEAAMYSVDSHNEASAWNKALLKNSGSPSGAMVYSPKGNEGAILTEEQYERLKGEVDEQYTGTRNAGRPMLLDGGLLWQQMGLSPKEMDWIEGKHVSSREICHAFGVPPFLLGIPGDSTYNNYKEARQGMYEDTILPQLDSLNDMLNMTIVPTFGDDIELAYDEDEIPALAPKRAEKWTMVNSATCLSTDEKREALGYEPLGTEEAQEILVPSMLTPLSLSLEPPAPPADPNNPDDPNADPNADPSKDEADAAKLAIRERSLAEKLVRMVGLNPKEKP